MSDSTRTNLRPSRTGAAIHQTRPFSGPEHELFLAVQRLASALAQDVAALLRPTGLSGPQYNVLRILRGAGDDGLACREVGERLVTRDPDVTRLLDRLEAQGLVARARSADDRRVVTTRLTPRGAELLASLDEPMAELHRRQLGHLGPARQRALLDLLEGALPDA